MASAAPTESQFPNIPFSAFNKIIESNFGSKISLATVLVLLFTLIENPDLFNLHFRQQHREHLGENATEINGWIIALSNALLKRLGKQKKTLLLDDEINEDLSSKDGVKCVAKKLDQMAVALDLTPYEKDGGYSGKLLPISLVKVRPVYIICPTSLVCATKKCKTRSLVQTTKDRDIPLVTLLKGNQVHENVPVLTGKCPACKTLYSADHERFLHKTPVIDKLKRVYLNDAKYLKVGQRLWVDRLFSGSVINAMYSFHASASAFAGYWNNTFGTETTNVSRAHIWQAFVQDSMRTVASESNINLELDDPLNITEVTTQAFQLLGEEGIIRSSDKHACKDCTQEYKKSNDAVLQDPAAVVGVDENNAVPPLAEDAMNISEEQPDLPTLNNESDDNINVAKRWTKMAVLDGLCMTSKVSFIGVDIQYTC